MQTGPTTGGPGIGPEGPGIGLGGLMNHMVQPDTIRPMALPYQPTVSPGLNLTHDVKPNAGPSSFTPMPIMANDPVSQFGDKPPIPSMPQQPAPQQAPQAAPQQQRPMSPLMQQQMMQQRPFQPQQQMGGLQQLLSQMMNRFQPQQRQQRSPMGMPQFRSQALQYRPNMTQAQQSLSRVKPSVQKQAQDAQAARIAELEAQLAGFNRSSNDYGGGG
jgi:hypothetical protein